MLAQEAKEKKRGEYRGKLEGHLSVMQKEGWTVVFTDGSAKQVGGWWKVGFGVFFEETLQRNYSAPVRPHKRQSVSRTDLRGILEALQLRQPDERMVIVLDSEYVYKGIMDCSPKWRRHRWQTASGEVGHRDLLEAILQLPEHGEGHVRLEWTHSHVRVQGIECADQLAEAPRLQHPNNKRRRTEPEWEALGLHPMDSGASSSNREGTGKRSASSEASWSRQSAGDTDYSASADSSSDSASRLIRSGGGGESKDGSTDQSDSSAASSGNSSSDSEWGDSLFNTDVGDP